MFKQFHKILVVAILALQAGTVCAAADMVIFSYNRPMQLYALLESVEKYITGLADVEIIYRADSDAYELAYQDVFADFPEVHPHRQGDQTVKDFKPLTLSCTFQSSTEYVIFAVDDIIVKDFIDLNECVRLLDTYKTVYGVYLRLGKNLNYCYSMNAAQAVPRLQEIEPGVFAWQFKQGQHDWGYPNTVDMTLYRKEDVRTELHQLYYTAPNNLEGAWACHASRIKKPACVCFETTKIVNLPLNRVQDLCGNRHMNLLTPQEMLDMYNNGLKIDISTLHQIDNKSAHMEYEPQFIERH